MEQFVTDSLTTQSLQSVTPRVAWRVQALAPRKKEQPASRPRPGARTKDWGQHLGLPALEEQVVDGPISHDPPLSYSCLWPRECACEGLAACQEEEE